MNKFITLLGAAILGAVAHAATYSGTLPVLFINTDGGVSITSKEDYVSAKYYLDPMGSENVQAIGSAQAPLDMQIRGRGNYTWVGFDKKPYRIKLADKQPLAGLNKSKHFALLAHADDNYGFMRNIVGFQLSRMIGMPWTPADTPVEVVLNGDYIGLYFLTETIRVDKDRVNIVEQPDNITNPEEITGGWLLEIDNYDSDPHVTVYEKDKDKSKIIFTYKTPEVLSQAQETYLTDNLNRLNDAIYNPDLNDNSWEDMVDTDILARYYIVQEIVDDYESFHGSCYLYKNIGNTKWCFGPVWDFGNAFTYDKTQYIYEGRQWHQTWIPQMCAHPHFMETVHSVWTEFENNTFDAIYSYVDDYAARIAAAARCDAERWPSYGNADVLQKADFVKQRLQGARRWLNAQWKGKETYNVGFVDNNTTDPWTNLHTYIWYVQGNDVVVVTDKWPGSPMTYMPATGHYEYSFKNIELPENTQIIFNNGHSGDGNQTADLKFVNNGFYDRDGYIQLGVNDITAGSGIVVKSGKGFITVISATAGSVTVTDITGASRIYPVEPGENRIDILPGFYIVGKQKVIVR